MAEQGALAIGQGQGEAAPRPGAGRRRSLPVFLAAAMPAIALAATVGWRPRPLLVWNASASSPIGLYRVSAMDAPRRGTMVVAWLPDRIRRLAAERHFLPANVPLVKRVGASAGDRVCAAGDRIFINGRLAALRRRTDLAGRPLPWWEGCNRLGRGETFLLSTRGPASFDGRYFGIIGARLMVGEARLIWPR